MNTTGWKDCKEHMKSVSWSIRVKWQECSEWLRSSVAVWFCSGQALRGPGRLGSQDFQTIGTWKRLSCQHCTQANFTPQGRSLVLISVRLSWAQRNSAARKIKSNKNINDPIGNGTRDLQACRALPQRTAPLCSRLVASSGISVRLVYRNS